MCLLWLCKIFSMIKSNVTYALLIRMNELAGTKLYYIMGENLIWAVACAFSFQATNRAGFAPAARRHLKRATRRLRISVLRPTARSCSNWKTPTSRRTVSVTSSFALWESSARRWRSPYVWPVCPLCLFWCSSSVSREICR